MADGNANGSDDWGWAIICALCVIVLFIIWHYFHYDIRNSLRWIRYGEIWVMSWILPDSYGVPWGGNVLNFEQWSEAIPNFGKEQITGEVSKQIAMLALYPFRWIYSALFVFIALWCMFKGPNTQFRRTHNLDTLLRSQANTFPYIAPFKDFNPSNQPARPPGAPVPAELPSFAEALGPEEWLVYEGIPVPDREESATSSTAKVDAGVATKAFSKQLGRPWRGWAHLPNYKQVLLASFCLKSVRKREESDALLGELALSWTYKNGLKISNSLLKIARSTLKNREVSGKVLSVCNQHAYENTAMLRGLLVARDEGGVLSPSQFVWLRALDRSLWYALNNLGRQTFHMEALGTMAHFRVEKLTQRPVLRPRVEDAVMKITEYMSSERARPIPLLDYSQSKKKRGVKKVKGT